MSQKEKVQIQRDETLASVDAELDAAMALVDSANVKVSDLLTTAPSTHPASVQNDECAQDEQDSLEEPGDEG